MDKEPANVTSLKPPAINHTDAAKSEAEIRKWFIGLAIECNNENPITPEDMTLLHEHKIPDNENAKCLLACVYRKANWINDKGMFDIEAANAMVEKEHTDEPAKIDNSKKLFQLCKKVDDEPVTDGEKGCQRAALLTTCMTENAPKFGIPLIM
ncbi:general odorant-binding protein 19d-like isoform X2 [Pectinophora gossypiella]|uniref:general odorant-binding protein 19d-like isoform X2 n=1 Tax=Pectinophora gossypiella TaxID=13191 RepID=UPI00214E3BE7|nr:general odorant-binding protein 19d-like isoform X2 [Pectinophora gossypiella]